MVRVDRQTGLLRILPARAWRVLKRYIPFEQKWLQCRFIRSIARVIIGAVLLNLIVSSVARILSSHKGPRHHWSDPWEGKEI